jgi:thiol:disulfide interchange protein DsbC
MSASMEAARRPFAFTHWHFLGLCLALLLLASLLFFFVPRGERSHSRPEAVVRDALAERLPRTRIDTVRCARSLGLCEVMVGPTLFYTDHAGRYLMVGRIYDLETRSDITAARLLELSPEMVLAGAPRVPGQQANRAAAEPTSRIKVADLPANAGILWGPPSGPKVTVFSDLTCSYCRRLQAELKTIGARVDERPISVLGTRRLSEAVWCSRDRAAALDAVYRTGNIATAAPPACDTSALDANEAFARRVGFTGTPVIVRSDGAVMVGYRPARDLRQWLAAVSPRSGGAAS